VAEGAHGTLQLAAQEEIGQRCGRSRPSCGREETDKEFGELRHQGIELLLLAWFVCSVDLGRPGIDIGFFFCFFISFFHLFTE
jgi:hypothetical protein